MTIDAWALKYVRHMLIKSSVLASDQPHDRDH